MNYFSKKLFNFTIPDAKKWLKSTNNTPNHILNDRFVLLDESDKYIITLQHVCNKMKQRAKSASKAKFNQNYLSWKFKNIFNLIKLT